MKRAFGLAALWAAFALGVVSTSAQEPTGLSEASERWRSLDVRWVAGPSAGLQIQPNHGRVRHHRGLAARLGR